METLNFVNKIYRTVYMWGYFDYFILTQYKFKFCFEFIQSKICLLTLRAKGVKIKWG